MRAELAIYPLAPSETQLDFSGRGELGGASPKRAKRLDRHAEHALTAAENAAKKDAKGRKPKLTAGCASAIHQAAEGVRSSLPR